MGSLSGRRVVLGVTGGIAAYKAVEVCRRLVDAGAHVSPILTDGAPEFVGATTFSALASEPAQTSLCDDRRPHPAHAARPDAPIWSWSARPRPASSSDIRTGRSRRPAHRDAARHPGTGGGLPGDAHRDVGAPVGPGEPRRPAPARRADRRRPRPAAWPAATSATGASPPPRPSSPRSSGRSAAGDLRRPVGCSSPPAAPASRSTRCATSATARPASRAMPSPPRPRRAGADVTLVTTTADSTRPAASRVVPVETAAEMAAAVSSSRPPMPTIVVMAAAVADFRPASAADTQAQEARRRAPRSNSSPPSTSSPVSANASRPARCSSGSPPRPTTSIANADAKLRAQEPRPDRRQRRLAARRRASNTTRTRS